MYFQPIFLASTHARAGGGQVFSEFIATFGLVVIILGCVRSHATAVPYAVAAYIAAAYWFAASTSFANPAVAFARAATNTFSGIRPIDVPGFVIAQLAGALLATTLCAWLIPEGGPEGRETRKEWVP